MNAFQDALQYLSAGGWILAGLGLIAFILYTALFQTAWYLWQHRHLRAPLRVWKQWVAQPEDAPPRPANVLQSLRESHATADSFIHVLHNHYLGYTDRRLPLLRILVSAAPLTGLLGTVNGLLHTFRDLGSEAANPTNAMAAGISQALITTQAGLIIAVPALIGLRAIISQRADLARSLSLLESVVRWNRAQQSIHT